MDEKTKILWAPNPGQTPQALDKICIRRRAIQISSGMEFIKKATLMTQLFIFDEVDAGIGGMTLNKVAEKIQSLSHKRQIILITHWPQLAAKARKHFQIKKIINGENTFTICEPITGKNRQGRIGKNGGRN